MEEGEEEEIVLFDFGMGVMGSFNISLKNQWRIYAVNPQIATPLVSDCTLNTGSIPLCDALINSILEESVNSFNGTTNTVESFQ